MLNKRKDILANGNEIQSFSHINKGNINPYLKQGNDRDQNSMNKTVERVMTVKEFLEKELKIKYRPDILGTLWSAEKLIMW